MKGKAGPLISILMILVANLACGFPAQDCELKSSTVQGTVQDVAGHPITGSTVIIVNKKGDEYGEAGRVDVTLTTGADGSFGTGVTVYKCDPLVLTVSKTGFADQHLMYSTDVGFSDSLPAQLVVTLKSTP